MPIYEYFCQDCRRCSSFFIRSGSDAEKLLCSHCRSANLQRIMSRFSAVPSEESRLEKLSDPGRWGGLDESDPSSVARFVKRMGSEMGEEVNRDELDQMADEAAQEAATGAGPEADHSPNPE